MRSTLGLLRGSPAPAPRHPADPRQGEDPGRKVSGAFQLARYYDWHFNPDALRDRDVGDNPPGPYRMVSVTGLRYEYSVAFREGFSNNQFPTLFFASQALRSTGTCGKRFLNCIVIRSAGGIVARRFNINDCSCRILAVFSSSDLSLFNQGLLSEDLVANTSTQPETVGAWPAVLPSEDRPSSNPRNTDSPLSNMRLCIQPRPAFSCHK